MPPRNHLLQIFNSALAAVDPYAAVRRFVQRDGDTLTLATHPAQSVNLSWYDRIWVLGAGKATAPMAQAIEEIVEDALTGGLIVVKYDHALPLHIIECREAGHPVPDENGLRAGDALLKMAEAATERDLVICLLSGGGSALLESLPPSLTLEDLQTTTNLLLASGASIVEVNIIRKHLSRVKGGRLAQAIAPALLITLVLSDVVGSPLTAIASGPTVPDPSTWAEVSEILMYFELMPHLPPAVRAHVEAGIRGDIPDTPKQVSASPTMIIGDNALAADAAFTTAYALGYHTTLKDVVLEGEAREVGKQIARDALTVQQNNYPLPACLIYGGETTVTLGATYGKGGRNQELALAAALELTNHPGIILGAFATDGSDGPTDSSGAMVDGGTVTRGGGMGVARQHLTTHNAYPFLDASGDLLRTGPTRTNVNDLIVVIIEAV
jgi:glycerate 2-kinase